MASASDISALANAIAESTDTDILFYNGPIARPLDTVIVNLCRKADRRQNVTLILVTEGGDPDAAYRVSRCLQQYYKRVTAFITGYCKSAGTIVVIGCHELVFGPHGELGPIDVQMSKRDDFEMQSGQTVMSSLQMLQEKAFMAFEHCFIEVQERTGGRISMTMASELAAKICVGLFSPIYQQIDPMHIGEAGRASSIAAQYGKRLDEVTHNLRPMSLDYLMSGYTSHGFVIDEREAKDLFVNVRRADDKEMALLEALEDEAIQPNTSKPKLRYLSSNKKGGANGQHEKGKSASGDSQPGPKKNSGTAIAGPKS